MRFLGDCFDNVSVEKLNAIAGGQNSRSDHVVIVLKNIVKSLMQQFDQYLRFELHQHYFEQVKI